MNLKMRIIKTDDCEFNFEIMSEYVSFNYGEFTALRGRFEWFLGVDPSCFRFVSDKKIKIYGSHIDYVMLEKYTNTIRSALAEYGHIIDFCDCGDIYIHREVLCENCPIEENKTKNSLESSLISQFNNLMEGTFGIGY